LSTGAIDLDGMRQPHNPAIYHLVKGTITLELGTYIFLTVLLSNGLT
jgi:hypothetical protein